MQTGFNCCIALYGSANDVPAPTSQATIACFVTEFNKLFKSTLILRHTLSSLHCSAVVTFFTTLSMRLQYRAGDSRKSIVYQTRCSHCDAAARSLATLKIQQNDVASPGRYVHRRIGTDVRGPDAMGFLQIR